MAGAVLRMTDFRKFEMCASYQVWWYKSATTQSRKTLWRIFKNKLIA
jgi:hypothetical protein